MQNGNSLSSTRLELLLSLKTHGTPISSTRAELFYGTLPRSIMVAKHGVPGMLFLSPIMFFPMEIEWVLAAQG
eukprot:1161552-Pelagomonas_calceolata.AAC.3